MRKKSCLNLDLLEMCSNRGGLVAMAVVAAGNWLGLSARGRKRRRLTATTRAVNPNARSFDLSSTGGPSSIRGCCRAAITCLGDAGGAPVAALGPVGHDAARKANAAACNILPGVHRHAGAFPRTGLTHKEDLESGSRGRRAGRVTAVFEMPNTDRSPPATQALADKGRFAGDNGCTAIVPTSHRAGHA